MRREKRRGTRGEPYAGRLCRADGDMGVSNPFACKILSLFVIHLKISSNPVEPKSTEGQREDRHSGIRISL